ncbi:MAG TPA: hypothetical protein DEQ34_08240 [Balneolaceae bacterium]|nr:hypothetical protein [Balneolaceae bacterium]|tara:strand:+ start:187321 stop:188145 length:825 start_codon:yes stop_codon:yes gene_type:complete
MKKISIVLSLLTLIVVQSSAYAQYGEPELQTVENPKNLYDEGYKTGLGFIFGLSDFGFGTGVQLRKGVSPYTEALLNLEIAGLRDPREQTYIDYYFTGGRTIPSKYKRVVTFPVTVGLKRRFFAKQVSDNFRFHTAMSFGPSMAVTFPYFKDYNGNGFRDANVSVAEFGAYEPNYDIFSGWKDFEWKRGWTGDLILGIDFGDNFASLQTFQFGYTFYYFKDGLQIMEPFEPVYDTNGSLVDENGDGQYDVQPSHDPTKYFGSAQITFIFGWMWD